MTQAAIAAALGLSAGTVSKLAAKGMPTDTLDAAKAWRANHAAEGVGHKSRHPAVTAAAKALQHLPPPPAPAGVLDGNDVEASLERLREAERQTYQMIRDALSKAKETRKDEDYAVLPGLLRTHNQAAGNRLEAERAWERHRLRTGQLVRIEVARNLIAERLGPLDAQLRNLAKLVAAQANPADPTIAERAITAGLNSIFKQIAKQTADLPKP